MSDGLSKTGRSCGLAIKLKELGKNYIGEIVRFANGVYEYCNSVDYDDKVPSNNKWLLMESLFK